ncbi:MarR family transcriptional regulator [Gilvimarinus sp. SDUM040013]|uniref:MarR family transcriptional regulator n=1 Tax=Gilvimarinus gilvus TaxID=3058038 RepID=A0ABU4RU02_9GAMM|nr:MarR family transcriptional regulator [Gilvimarinus sp. SDUM040013]MDO3384995.1 MarR family transcriptional regulator [Gilvimarinus sp. SDUM040013]MDX6848370.1 MarR family transcriptional regulator [Gilvimarinus sp. SDUM040013]
MQDNTSTASASVEAGHLHLNNSLIFWVNRLASAMRETFNEALAVENISWPQWMSVNVLAHEEADTPAKIAECLGVDRSAITRLLDRLVDKGLVQRQHDDGDRRSVRVYLTPEGKSLAKRVDQLALEHQQRFLSQLPATEVRVFKSHVQKLLREAGVESSRQWRTID